MSEAEIVVRLRPSMLVWAAAFSTVTAIAVAWWGPHMSPVVLVAMPIIVPATTWSTLRLSLDPSGVVVASSRMSWDEVTLTTTRRGKPVLARRPGVPGRGPRIVLTHYEPEWRLGRIGAAIQRWAPHLLDGDRS